MKNLKDFAFSRGFARLMLALVGCIFFINAASAAPVAGATISGHVYCDVSGNGSLDPGDDQEMGVTVTLTKASDNSFVDQMVTADLTSQGIPFNYTFGNLQVGQTYNVTISVPTGFVVTGTQPNPSNGTVVSSTKIQVTVPGGIFGSGNNNFFISELHTVSGTVFHDFNGNGMQDIGEPGIPNITVTLSPLNLTTTTDANGDFAFTGLLPGSYTACADSGGLPSGFVPTTPLCLTVGLVGCDGADQAVEVGFRMAANGATRTAGYWKTHLLALTTAVNLNCVNLGVIGSQNLTMPTIGDLEAIFWASDTRQGNAHRSDIGKARMKLANQLIAAYCNVCLLGTSTGSLGFSATLLQDATAALASSNITLMNQLMSQLDAFNNAGDNVPFNGSQSAIVGPADPNGAKAAANRDLSGTINPLPGYPAATSSPLN
jgi:hypothetical protein